MKNILNRLNAFYFKENMQKFFSMDRLFACFISSFLFSNIIQIVMNESFVNLKVYYNSINFSVFWAGLIIPFVVQILFTYYMKNNAIIPYSLFFTSTVLSILFSIGYTENGVYFLAGIAFIDFLIIKWLINDDKLYISKLNVSYKVCFIVSCVLCVLSTIIIGYFTSLKYLTFNNSTFDFGIFAQMFEYMKNTGQPFTTVERNQFLSHFGVHFSPIFYLFLPGYFIFSSPIYLFYSQAFVIAVGVFAVYLICRQLSLSGKVTLAFILIYISYPSLFNAAFYDFHENKILTSLILFLFYFILSKKTWGIITFSLLTLMVKEDAAIYLIAIALYMILATKEVKRGFAIAGLAVIYFVVANIIVSANGEEGVMMWRLSDYFVDDQNNYFSVFKGIFFNIGYLIKMVFTPDKLPFVIWMLLPVAFTPLANKKLSVLVLLLPMIPINLMQQWQYQYDINYQYSYGVAALIIFASIITIKEFKPDLRRLVILFSAVISVVMFSNLTVVKIRNHYKNYKTDSVQVQNTEQALKMIPEDASVTAYQCFVPHLYWVSELYSIPDYYESGLLQSDYFVVDTRYNDSDKYNASEIMQDNYTQIGSGGYAIIYKRIS